MGIVINKTVQFTSFCVMQLFPGNQPPLELELRITITEFIQNRNILSAFRTYVSAADLSEITCTYYEMYSKFFPCIR
jgi:hypothetical protein